MPVTHKLAVHHHRQLHAFWLGKPAGSVLLCLCWLVLQHEQMQLLATGKGIG